MIVFKNKADIRLDIVTVVTVIVSQLKKRKKEKRKENYGKRILQIYSG